MRFGLNVSAPAVSGWDPVGDAVAAEELGFDFVSASDHLHGSAPTHEPWTMLTSIAAVTSRIHVATRVLAVPYRHPAVVAKMAETLDRLSGGRVVLGLGGGYSDAEFRAFGLGERSPGEKVAALEEAVRIVRGLWSGEPLTFEGQTYHTNEAQLAPRPERRVPIWLGTYGPRALALTGRLADGWIPTMELAPPDRVGALRDRVLRAADEAGRDPAEIECVYNVDVRVDEDAPESPGVLSGPPDLLVERLQGFARLGFSAFNFLRVGDDLAEQAERLGTEVIPAVRAPG
jgi:probable F420-dependent oxidoreductase